MTRRCAMRIIIRAKNANYSNISCCDCDSIYNTGSCTDTCYPDFANVTRNDFDAEEDEE